MSSNLPPGVTDSMIEDQTGSGPCVLCLKPFDDCECDECKACGEAGCIEHLPTHVLLEKLHFFEFVCGEYKTEIDKRTVKVECCRCGLIRDVDFYNGFAYCEPCDKITYPATL